MKKNNHDEVKAVLDRLAFSSIRSTVITRINNVLLKIMVIHFITNEMLKIK